MNKPEKLTDDDIAVQNIMVEDRAAGYNAGSTPDEFRFALTEDMLVTTNKVDELSAATKAISDLLAAGVVFSSDSYSAGASFVFTGIADLKNDMLKEATQRAKESAQQLAAETGAKLEVATVRSIPDTFELMAPGHRPHGCRVVWRSLKEMGVEFT